MNASALSDKLVEAIEAGVITEQDAIEYLVAAKRGDEKTIERLKKEYEAGNK